MVTIGSIYTDSWLTWCVEMYSVHGESMQTNTCQVKAERWCDQTGDVVCYSHH